MKGASSELIRHRLMIMQLSLFPTKQCTVDLRSYDYTIIAFSGGKDSLACLLWAIANNAPNIELWHHDVDGREGSTLMDWPVTRAYCQAIAQAFNLPIYFSWLEGGFEREMLRDNQKTAPTFFETPEGINQAGGITGKNNTRLKFPQVSGNLSVRWCSAYLKIGVCSKAIANQERFTGKRTLVLSGERAQESPQRAKYNQFEPDKTNCQKRHVDRFRPVHQWTEQQVWEIIQRHKVNPHPAYHLGWGRLSCMSCIFGSANQWASIKTIAPEHFEAIATYEEQFNCTIQRSESVRQMAARGIPYAGTANLQTVGQALSTEFNQQVFIEDWKLPSGAYGEQNGSV